MRRSNKILAFTVVLAISSSALAQSATKSPAGPSGGAYDKLDPTRLVDTLSQMGMLNLLTTYADELATGPDANAAKYAQGEIIVMKARALVSNPSAYLAEMDKAAAKFKEVVDATQKTTDMVSLLRAYRYRMHLADVMGTVSVSPYTDRLLYLQGGPEDRKIVADRTTEAAKTVLTLQRNAKDKLVEVNNDTTLRMQLGTDMEDFETLLAYKAAFIYLNRGLAVDDAKEKMTNLRAAIDSMQRFAEDTENEMGLKYEAMLLTGRCSRELKEYQRAVDMLKGAAAKEADATVRMGANFELGRCLVEKGDFDVAKAHIEAFHKIAQDILGPSGAVTADVQYAFLKGYLYDAWSESLAKTDPAKSGELAAQAQKAQLEFVNAHPNEASAFYDMISSRYAGQPPEKLNSMIVVANVSRDLGKIAPDATEAQRNAAYQKAIDTLQIVTKRDDAASKEVRPQALYTMAVIYSKMLQNANAGKMFLQVANDAPDNALAFNSVLNAAISFSNIIQDRLERNMTVSRQYRMDLVASLEKLFSRKDWAAKREAQSWMFSLAWQYDKLADAEEALASNGGSKPSSSASASPPAAPNAARLAYLAKATDAYEKVSPEQPEYMEARFMALQTRKEALAGFSDASSRRTAADALSKACQKYLADAAQAMQAAQAGKKDAEVKQLREWSADSEVLIATLNFEHLDLKTVAVNQLKAVADKWKDTNSLKTSAQLLIQYSLLDGRTDEAAAQVRTFREKFPDEAAGLIRLVVQQLQDQIKSLRYDANQKSALNGYRHAYFEFANLLYEDNKKTTVKATADQLYPYEQMKADATLELGLALRDEGKPEEASRQFAAAQQAFEACKALDDKKRDEMSKQLDDRFAKKGTEAMANGISSADITKRAEELLTKDLPACQVDWRNMSSAVMVNVCLQSLKKENTPENVAALQRAVSACYVSLLKQLKRGLPIDPVNLWGLARSYRVSKKYQESMTYYRQLITGVDKDKNAAQYWQAELEHDETALEGLSTFPNKAEQASKLLARIRQIRGEDPDMGGLKGPFAAIEAQVDKQK